ncbi:MAG: hypothetical protein HOP19_29130 [Acidobacteria bacterium]|nr:hypothetical protein [Acidobacteriota bacterium]
MNYFNYFSEVESEFVKRRGSHLLVSPLDWSLIESWKQRGVPLHVVLRGINSSFDGYDKRLHRGRKVNTLFFCQQEVEALFLDHTAAHIGGNGSNGHVTKDEDASIFSVKRVIEHLHEQHALLDGLNRQHENDWPLAEVFGRAAARLHEIVAALNESSAFNAEALETDLTLIENVILEGLKQCADAETLKSLEKDTNKQMRAYKDKMEAAVFEQTRQNYLARRLRETYRVPRLSLFYLN